jgi:signal transduction histidine kinase
VQFPIECMSNIQERIGIKVEALSEEICSHIITDKQWLQENLLCLLSNAVKYSTEGSVTIKGKLCPMKREVESNSVSLFTLRSAKRIIPVTDDADIEEHKTGNKVDCLVFEVEDTGIGVSEEAMKNLFNPFKQAQRLAGGTGLGLYSLAKRMDIERSVWSSCKRGWEARVVVLVLDSIQSRRSGSSSMSREREYP